MSLFEGFRFRTITSPIHRLDPRGKFFYVCVMFVVAILFSELIPLLALFFIQILIIIVAKVQRQWAKSMRGALYLAIFIFGTNLLTRYFFSGYTITPLDFEYSAAMTLRFVVLIQSFSIFFLTTSPDHLGLALEQSHFPYQFCFAFTTAVRFVPVLADEAKTIMDAQKARGLELEKGNFMKRVKNYIPILIPLIVGAIRRSLELAEAMESRAWGAVEKRTNLYVLKIEGRDLILISFSIALLVTAISVKVLTVYFGYTIPTITSLLPINL